MIQREIIYLFNQSERGRISYFAEGIQNIIINKGINIVEKARFKPMTIIIFCISLLRTLDRVVHIKTHFIIFLLFIYLFITTLFSSFFFFFFFPYPDLCILYTGRKGELNDRNQVWRGEGKPIPFLIYYCKIVLLQCFQTLSHIHKRRIVFENYEIGCQCVHAYVYNIRIPLPSPISKIIQIVLKQYNDNIMRA